MDEIYNGTSFYAHTVTPCPTPPPESLTIRQIALDDKNNIEGHPSRAHLTTLAPREQTADHHRSPRRPNPRHWKHAAVRSRTTHRKPTKIASTRGKSVDSTHQPPPILRGHALLKETTKNCTKKSRKKGTEDGTAGRRRKRGGVLDWQGNREKYWGIGNGTSPRGCFEF